MSAAADHHAHGSVAEEALRLVEALSAAAGAGDPSADAAASSDCAWCPLCRAVRAVRPEVREHLAAAGASLVAALAAALAPPADMMGPQRSDDPATEEPR